jgi:hypothetical protein
MQSKLLCLSSCIFICLIAYQVGILGSSGRMETPEETLSRIAYGGYCCHVNATSGGGTYSSEDDDEFTLL